MSVLVLGPNEKIAIQEAIARARNNPLPWEAVASVVGPSDTTTLDLDERNPGVEDVRRKYPSQQLMLGTYRVAISFEQQPAGMFRHLSISSIHKGRVPGLEIVIMVLEEFGFSGWPLQRPNRTWFEEFEPGWRAFNVIELHYEN
jgi:hypothetical protein